MKHVKLFESFINEKQKDDKNISLKKARKPEEPEMNEEAKGEKEVSDRLEKLFQELVPPAGAAKTLEGEMVRAIMRVWYRYYNDGDYWFKGYGEETAGPSVRWLRRESPLADEMDKIFVRTRIKSSDEYSERDAYLKTLIKAAELICNYVEGKNGKYEPNNSDSR